MATKRIQAISNSRRFKANNQYRYSAVDGRVYNAEKDQTKPLPMRKDQIRKGAHNERVNARQLHKLEIFCGETETKWSQAQRNRIVSEYGLCFDEKARLYTTDEKERVFELLKDKYPKAREYTAYNGLLYAMRYGDTPCTVYYEEKA